MSMTMPAWICLATPGFIRLITIAPTRIAAGGMWPTRPLKAAPILLLVRDAAGSDPELRAVLEELGRRPLASHDRRQCPSPPRSRPPAPGRHSQTRRRCPVDVQLGRAVRAFGSASGHATQEQGQFVADAMIDALLS